MFVDAPSLSRALTWPDAVAALESAFAAPTLPDTPPRTVLQRGRAQMLLMPSWGPEAAGVKLITVQPDNPSRDRPLINGAYVLFAGDTLEPLAYLDASALTAFRTAAVSAVATKYLAQEGAGRLVVFGAGVQAEAHVHALGVVRQLRDVVIVPRSRESGEALVTRLRDGGFDARVGAAEAVAEADLVCTCTTSSTPVLEGARLQGGCHVNAVGTHSPEAREVDTATVVRAFVVVETRAAAQAEAGDLVIPLSEGAVEASEVPAAELGEVVRGGATGRSEADITLFKSVGVGFEDLALARFAYERIHTAGAQTD